MMLMLLLLPTTPARKRAEFRSSKIQIRAEQLQCFNLQKSCPTRQQTQDEDEEEEETMSGWVGGQQ
jgi:hypothetical protein